MGESGIHKTLSSIFFVEEVGSHFIETKKKRKNKGKRKQK